MKLQSSILFSAMIFSAALAGVGCSTQRTHDAKKDLCCETSLQAPPVQGLTDKSIYQLDSSWTNDSLRSIKLSALRGHVQVVAMFFTSCQYACPIIVHDMKRIKAALTKNELSNVSFTLVTFDTDRDSLETLRAYRENQHLETNRWNLLRGNADDTLEFAALLGVKYKRDINGQFSHSNIITVLNSQGEIIRQQIGLNQDIDAITKAIENAAHRGQ